MTTKQSENNNKELSDKLKTAREKLGLTQEEVAELAGRCAHVGVVHVPLDDVGHDVAPVQ